MEIQTMNVLSLFDGISCGHLALDRAQIKVDSYYASEIDRHAIRVAMANYPSTIQLGDVKNIRGADLPKIDLLMGGSPCQSFSSSGKRTGFDGKSGLFWEYARVLKEVSPAYFLLENVVMRKEWEDMITAALGVGPIMINSSLVSAQHRKRLYWTNIPGVALPEDRGVELKDILEAGDMMNKATIVGRRLSDRGTRDDYNKDISIVQCLEVRATNKDKSNCLTTAVKDNVLTSLPVGRHPDVFGKRLPYRYYTLKEYCRLQTIPEDYFKGVVGNSQAMKLIGNGWTVDVIAHIFKNLKETYEDKGD
jgi:site-specific DNA-cytosine methylase